MILSTPPISSSTAWKYDVMDTSGLFFGWHNEAVRHGLLVIMLASVDISVISSNSSYFVYFISSTEILTHCILNDE